MKIGNTDFNTDAIKSMTLKQFKDIYKGKLKGVDLEEAFKTLGGKIYKRKK